MRFFKLKKDALYPLVGALAFLPLLGGFALHHMYDDVRSLGQAVGIILNMQIEQSRIEGVLFKMQSLETVDENAVVEQAKDLLATCRDLQHQSWYDKSSDYHNLRNSMADLCDFHERRVQQISLYRSDVDRLAASLSDLPRNAKALSRDPSRLVIDDLERDIRNFASHPSLDEEARLQTEIASLKGARYDEFKSGLHLIILTAKARAESFEPLIGESTYELGNRAYELHNTGVLEEDTSGTGARIFMTAISAFFAFAITIIVYLLAKTSRSLRDLNRTLEEKVAQRTAELESAIEQISGQQAVLAHSAKMSALGEMAGGIAHEINTPLAAISLTAELLAADAEQLHDKSLSDGLQTITLIVERIAKIVQGLKRFSRSDEGAVRAPVKFTQILDDTLLLCGEKLKARGVVLEVSRKDDDALLNCVPEQISQVLINLLNNSVDAIETQKTKRIYIETMERDGLFSLRVSDSGAAIPASVRMRLMEPLFTTKQSGKGTGLGLSISRDLVRAHQGTLEFDGYARETTFVMTMPIQKPERSDQAPDLAPDLVQRQPAERAA